MTSEELLRVLRAQPFQPFVIRTAGRESRVTHPEAVGVQGRIAAHVLPGGGVDIIDLFLIESLHVESPVGPGEANGGQ
jgi:hypothetical protein